MRPCVLSQAATPQHIHLGGRGNSCFCNAAVVKTEMGAHGSAGDCLCVLADVGHGCSWQLSAMVQNCLSCNDTVSMDLYIYRRHTLAGSGNNFTLSN